ncbi:MAG: ribbon-helix-helix protein, CopG family [Gemmatimonadales bacterium]
MKRTTVFLEEALLRRARQLARREGRSFAHVVREALARYVGAQGQAGKLPSVAGMFRSGHSDTSERAEELLWQDSHD